MQMANRKVMQYNPKPQRGLFKTQEEITKANKKKREETISRLGKVKK